ncbi:MAG: hypothetical protein NVS2B14_06100 [Chamaesiphon sp.]
MDEELKAQIQELIAASIKGAIAPLVESQARQLTDMKQQVAQTVAESSSSWLDKLIEEAESVEDEDDYEDEGDYEEVESTPASDPETAKRLKRQELEIQRMKDQFEQERQMRVKAESERAEEARQRARETMTNQAIEVLQKTGQFRNPKQLFTLLQQEGLIEEQDGQLVAKIKDDYGYPASISLADNKFVDSLLSSDDYAHFANARPGTGTGATPGSGYTPQRNKHIKDGMSGEDYLKLAQDESAWKETLSELKNAIA